MPPDLPEELLDRIVDLLRDSRDALRSCCFVSKSWIPRARKHLFAAVFFETPRQVQSWKDTFPDPSTSPARYVEYLGIGSPWFVTKVGVEEGRWISTFLRVVHLGIVIRRVGTDRYLTPFEGLSTVTSLSIDYTADSHSRISDFIRSFPLLDNLYVRSDRSADSGDDIDGRQTTPQPSNSPPFTGSLKVSICGGMKQLVSRLLAVPHGLHFQNLDLTWKHKTDLSLTAALVERCSSTLECLKIDGGFIGIPI